MDRLRDFQPTGLRALQTRLYRESLARAIQCAEDFERASIPSASIAPALDQALLGRIADRRELRQEVAR